MTDGLLPPYNFCSSLRPTCSETASLVRRSQSVKPPRKLWGPTLPAHHHRQLIGEVSWATG
jgi:hypothetical protein